MSNRLKALLKREGKRLAIAGALEAAAVISRTGIASKTRGQGTIFTLHHVRPYDDGSFAANRHLEITPEFLEQAIEQLRGDGYDFIPLAEIPRRLQAPGDRPFAAFTLDDGYRNNAEHALPVFERQNVPFTIFVTRGFTEHTHTLWWETLGRLLGRLPKAGFDFGRGVEDIDLSKEVLKLRAFGRFATFVTCQDETLAVSRIDAWAKTHGVDPLAVTAELVMDEDELRRIATHPLASLGAHTLSHRAVGRLQPEEAKREMAESADWVKALTGTRPASFAYPYGFPGAVTERDVTIAREVGFSVAVTTQPGIIKESSAGRLTDLPRISLNGYFQRPRYVSALASGIPFALSKG
jgi:peptidoglycan/xylan/chitin deacetylase (PgdA/CDA1 family)